MLFTIFRKNVSEVSTKHAQKSVPVWCPRIEHAACNLEFDILDTLIWIGNYIELNILLLVWSLKGG